MVKLLPFIVIIVLVLGGLGYWRFVGSRSDLTAPEASQAAPVEVPKNLPVGTIDDRVKSLEDSVNKLTDVVNRLKPATSQVGSAGSSDSRVADLEATVTQLNARVASLEKSNPASVATSGKSIVYIPLGSGGGPWNNTDWNVLPEYEISLNPDNFPGYSGMNLEVTFRVDDPSGTGSVRFYNVTDGSVVSSQLDTTSTVFNLQSSLSFKLAAGAKTYRLQVKDSGGKHLFIQTARVKVNY